MDKIMENVIEITQVYDELMRTGKLDDDIDSLMYKDFICDLAAEFEELNKDVEWDGGDRDYYIEIGKFAENKLLAEFGIEGNEHGEIYMDTEIGQLYAISGDNGVEKYVEIGIGARGKYLPIYAIEVMNEGAEEIALYEGVYNDGEYEGLGLVKVIDLKELNNRAIKSWRC